MRCPICKKKTCYYGNPYRPFCSERCKLIDLHNWLSERYRFSTPVKDQAQDSPSPMPEQGAEEGRG